MVLNDIWPPPPTLPSTGRGHSIPSVTLGFQGLTAFARPCESSVLFTVVLDQDYVETLPREGGLASCPAWSHLLISVVEERWACMFSNPLSSSAQNLEGVRERESVCVYDAFSYHFFSPLCDFGSLVPEEPIQAPLEVSCTF